MRAVMIETPFAGKGTTEEAIAKDRQDNILYARACCRDSYKRGEMPIASHLLYPQFMDDTNPTERDHGIGFGYALWPHCEALVFYVDKGMSRGMVAALERSFTEGKPIEFRRLVTKDQLPGTKDSIVTNEVQPTPMPDMQPLEEPIRLADRT